jgi:hypothetical protein
LVMLLSTPRVVKIFKRQRLNLVDISCEWSDCETFSSMQIRWTGGTGRYGALHAAQLLVV